MTARRIRVRGIKRQPIDEDKLALAFLLLAKSLHEGAGQNESSAAASGRADGEAEGAAS